MVVIQRRYAVTFFITVAAVLSLALQSSASSQSTRLLTRYEVKKLFPYTFNDVADNLVIINMEGGGSGSGFIARVEGESYIYTCQHVLLGAGRVSFTTVGGRRLQPTGVELSRERDIARLPLAEEETGGFGISGDIEVRQPVAVFGNSEGAGVAGELYGQVLLHKDDMVEVSNEFVSGNSGSPILATNGQAIGIASVIYYDKTDTHGVRSRRCGYMLEGDECLPVDWKAFNRKHGREYRQCMEFVNSVESLYDAWSDDPYRKLASDNFSDDRLRNWADRHNQMIDDTLKFTKYGERQYAGYKQVEQANERIKEEMRTRSRVLAMLCRSTAKDMSRFASQKSITGFQKAEYESFAEQLEATATEVELVGEYLAEQDIFSIR